MRGEVQIAVRGSKRRDEAIEVVIRRRVDVQVCLEGCHALHLTFTPSGRVARLVPLTVYDSFGVYRSVERDVEVSDILTRAEACVRREGWRVHQVGLA